MDNKPSIHFGKDKTKFILFASKHKTKLNTTHENVQINQYLKVRYLSCILDEKVSGESVPLKVIDKISSRLNFLHSKNKFLTPALSGYHVMLLFNLTLIIQPWYPNLTHEI